MAEKIKAIEISNFNQGGLSDSRWSGIKYSVYKMIGWDPHSVPGVLRVAQKMVKDSGATVDEFCKRRLSCSNGIMYWASATSGKIWQNKPSAGVSVWELVATIAPGAGAAAILGMREYQGYIYIATQSRLHRIAIINADGAAAWLANLATNWATFTKTDVDFPPMIEQNLVLYIGDGNLLAQVDAGVFSASALDIAAPLRIKCLGKTGTDVLLGTYVADSVTATQIVRWNTWSESFSSSDEIPEVGINAFFPADNSVLVSAGLSGNIYYYDGNNLELYKKIPGIYSPTATATVHPEAVDTFGGDILFGLSQVTGNPTDFLVYRFGRNSKNYPYILDQPYPISERSGSNFVLSDIQIGAVLVSGYDIYVSWKNGSSYGVDKLDWNTKLDGAYLESRVEFVSRDVIGTVADIITPYYSMPSGCSIDFYTSKNYAVYGSALTLLKDVDRMLYITKDAGDAFNTIQLKIKATTSANDGPEIESSAIFLS